jgi:tetratricopeptide (TPR) repeat protein
LSHQAAGYLLVQASLYDRALAEFQQAIALEPGDPWSYVLMGFALTGKGQAAEALSYIRTGMRLDPNYPETFLWFLGQALFGAERYDEAAAALESAIKLNPDDDAVLALLGATYGLLGRVEDAKAAFARFNERQVKRGDVPLTVSDSDTFGTADQERLKKGFRLAGVPESLAVGEFAERNRMTAEEVRALFLGHRLRGRSLSTGQERSATVADDGHAVISGDWGNFTGGMLGFKEDQVCFYKKYCGNVFRNPGAPTKRENEYIWYDQRKAYTFSQIE